MLLHCLFALIILEFGCISSEEKHGKDCETPEGYSGICQDIRNCQPLLSLYGGMKNDRKVKKYLLASALECGGGYDPIVCCLKNATSAIDDSENLCGKNSIPSSYIQNGIDTAHGEFPWMVALGYIFPNNISVRFGCGGSLISDKWVLTAEHCVDMTEAILKVVRVGEHDLLKNDEDGVAPIDIPVDQYFKYDKSIVDVALIRLWKPVSFTKFVRPICLFTGKDYEKDALYSHEIIAIGWGVRGDKENNNQTNVLQKATLKIMNSTKCNEELNKLDSHLEMIQNVMFCSSNLTINTCKGDSGGPVMMLKGVRYYLVGISASGNECNKTTSNIGVYMNVTIFDEWIRETIRKSSVPAL